MSLYELMSFDVILLPWLLRAPSCRAAVLHLEGKLIILMADEAAVEHLW